MEDDSQSPRGQCTFCDTLLHRIVRVATARGETGQGVTNLGSNLASEIGDLCSAVMAIILDFDQPRSCSLHEDEVDGRHPTANRLELIAKEAPLIVLATSGPPSGKSNVRFPSCSLGMSILQREIPIRLLQVLVQEQQRPKLVRRVALLDTHAVWADRKGEVPLIDIPEVVGLRLDFQLPKQEQGMRRHEYLNAVAGQTEDRERH